MLTDGIAHVAMSSNSALMSRLLAALPHPVERIEDAFAWAVEGRSFCAVAAYSCEYSSDTSSRPNDAWCSALVRC